MKIKKIFNIYNNSSKSKDLSEEEIYSLININTKKEDYIPVISSKTTEHGIVGYIPKPNINIEQYSENKFINVDGVDYFINKKGSITVSKDGLSGFMYYKDPDNFPIYSVTTHGTIFSPKSEINLQWFIHKYQNLFLKHNHKGKNNHFGKAIYDTFDLDIPSELEIKKEEELYIKLISLRNELINKINKIEKILEKNIELKKTKMFYLKDVFKYVRRNDGLTEIGIYKLLKENLKKERINLLDGSARINGVIDKSIKEIPIISGGKLKNQKFSYVENKNIYALVVNGDAGKLKLYPTGNFAGNSDVYPIFLNETVKKDLNINNSVEYDYMFFIKNNVEQIFRKQTSGKSKGQGKRFFAMKAKLKDEEIEIHLPLYTKELQIYIEKMKKIEKYKIFLEKKLNKIEDLLKKDIIYED